MRTITTILTNDHDFFKYISLVNNNSPLQSYIFLSEQEAHRHNSKKISTYFSERRSSQSLKLRNPERQPIPQAAKSINKGDKQMETANDIFNISQAGILKLFIIFADSV